MKYLLLFLIFTLPSVAFSSDSNNEPSQESEYFFINEKHRYFCGLKSKLLTENIRTCTYQNLEDESTQELGGEVSKVLTHFKDESFRRQCSSRYKGKWDVAYYNDKEMAKYLPKDRSCACHLLSKRTKNLLCTNNYFKDDRETILRNIRPIVGQINMQYDAFNLKSHIYSNSKKTCEVREIQGCGVKLNSSEDISKSYIENFENYHDSLINTISEKAWAEEALKDVRLKIREKGDVLVALKEFDIVPDRFKFSCNGNWTSENKHLKALFSVKEFFERICLSSDSKSVLEILKKSSVGEAELNRPLNEFIKIDADKSMENDCSQLNKAMSLVCDLEMKKISLADYYAMNPDYLKKFSHSVHPALNEGIRCLGHKRDDIEYHSMPKIYDMALRNFNVEMDRKKEELPLISLEDDKRNFPKVKPRSREGDNKKLDGHEAIVPKFVVKPPSKRDDKKSVPEIEYSPVTGDEATLHKPEIFRPSVAEITVEIPEKQALMSFGSVRKEVDLEKNSGTLTEEKKQEYREVEKQYEEILGRDLDIFSDNVDEIRNEIVVERGTKEYTRIANEASQLSTEVQALTKRAMTAGPRERFQIQGRLKKISNKLRSYKKFGYDFRVKVPTIEQILNVGRGDSHDQLSSFSAIESSHNSGGSYRPAQDLKVSDYEPEDSGSNFPNFKLPAAGLGPAQDFTKNFTTGPTKLLPEKNYPVGAKKNNVAARGATKSSGASGVRRGPASRGGSSGGGISSVGSLGLSGGGASSPSAYSNTRTYQVENKSYEPQVLNNAEKPATKVVFVEDLKVMRVFKLNDEKVYEIDAEYTEDSFKENYSQFEEEVKLDGEQFFRYRVKDMERMLRENKL